jgi:NAD(P)-dependent dehydrogenase (short-subunit alcohol dehydrogenase family)
MDYQLRGKLAFVTAGAHGIGEAIANLLTEEGAVVFVADQDADALRSKHQRWAAADLSTAEGVEAAITAMLENFGRAPDILVNNLGLADPAPFEDLGDERWLRAFQLNVMGCVRTCRKLLPLMAALGSPASVVNIGSDLARQPEPVPADYGACKAGIL